MSVLELLNPDGYAFNARVRPALFASMPVAAGLWAWLPSANGLGWIVPFVVAAGVPYASGEKVADIGRRKQANLWELWGGSPMLQVLRHRSTTLNPQTLARARPALGQACGVTLPTPEAESADPGSADEIYRACEDRIRILARDNGTPVIARANANYGFRRNLWAIRHVARLAAFAGLVAGIVRWGMYGYALPPLAAVIVGATMGVYLLTTNGEWVRSTGIIYGERVLESADRLVETRTS